MGMRFNRQVVLKTKFGTSTQKCEAVNSAYMRSLPKSKTFQRNIFGRIHSRIHFLNNGRYRSSLLKLRALGVKFHPRGPAMLQIKREQDKVLYDRKRQKHLKYKHERSKRAQKKYSMYDNRPEKEPTYKKRMLDPDKLVRDDHSYCEFPLKVLGEHSYSKCSKLKK